VEICVADDGAGIAVQGVARAAVERGLIEQARVKVLSDEDIYPLVFASDLSTRTAVTDISENALSKSAGPRASTT